MRGTFEASHSLRGDFGPATRLHGHTYRVEVAVRGASIGPEGTLVDLGMLQRLLDAALAALNDQNLDGLAVFGGENTTAEVVARYLFTVLQGALAGAERASTARVTVWESPTFHASYEGPLR